MFYTNFISIEHAKKSCFTVISCSKLNILLYGSKAIKGQNLMEGHSGSIKRVNNSVLTQQDEKLCFLTLFRSCLPNFN